MQMIKVYHTRPERRTRRSLYFQNGASNCLVTAQLLQNAPCVIIFSHHLHNYRNNPFFTKLNCQRNSFHENNLSNSAQLYSTSREWSRNIRFGLSQAMQLKLYIAQDEERNQCRLEPFQRFPCKNTAPSKTIPSSVHKLRPGDIKVKMAIFCMGLIL